MYKWNPDWSPVDNATGFQWNEGWDIDHAAFKCGIDFSVPHENMILPGELDMIQDWYRTVEGEVPAFVRHSAKYYPLQLLSFRARFETTVDGHLPKQYVALARLILAVVWHEPKAARRCLHMARHFGVMHDQAIQALAFAQLYGGDLGTDSSFEVVEDILDNWPA
jgi:hypothetical protein